NLSGNALTQAIRDERLKELIGEGFRLSDLRRWNEGFTRDSSYPISPDIEGFFVNAGKTLSYQPGDYRMVWPIPATEIQSNPQLDGQQNPGY
ncbi:MAG: RagB/SusD family nutrient uptake outer membrane protein, partial [Bacteroides sp.]|nr:RagB/SusD family nutrient uptake outer membrane protein [Bacteroides sp.]